MGKFSGCLLLADIDNTLVCAGDRNIPERNLKAIKYFTDNGGLFTVGTGRTVVSAIPPFNAAGGNTLVLCSNGGTLYDTKENKEAYRVNISDEDKKLLISIIEKFPEYSCEIQNGADVYLVSDGIAARWHANYEVIDVIEGFKPTDLYDLPWSKGIFLFENHEDKEKLLAYTKTLNPKDAFFVETAAGDGVHEFIEFHTKLSNKGDGSKKLKELTDSKMLFSIGDYLNDIAMLEAADVSACVLEAPDEVKAVSDYVVCSCKDGAVADFIEIIEKIVDGKN